jgi:hypothetical protein
MFTPLLARYPRKRIAIAKRKLNFDNPVEIMCDELQENALATREKPTVRLICPKCLYPHACDPQAFFRPSLSSQSLRMSCTRVDGDSHVCLVFGVRPRNNLRCGVYQQAPMRSLNFFFPPCIDCISVRVLVLSVVQLLAKMKEIIRGPPKCKRRAHSDKTCASADLQVQTSWT